MVIPRLADLQLHIQQRPLPKAISPHSIFIVFISSLMDNNAYIMGLYISIYLYRTRIKLSPYILVKI